MVDVQSRLADLREEAYAKVLKCLPYPRQWVSLCRGHIRSSQSCRDNCKLAILLAAQGTEMLITSLRNEFGIIDEVHEEILDAVMTNTERPKKRYVQTLQAV